MISLDPIPLANVGNVVLLIVVTVSVAAAFFYKGKLSDRIGR